MTKQFINEEWWHPDPTDNPKKKGWYWTQTYFINKGFTRPAYWNGQRWNHDVWQRCDGPITLPVGHESALKYLERVARS